MVFERSYCSFRRVAVIVAALGSAACAGDKSPLVLWDMRAGMPMTQLDSIALHDQHERFTCMQSYGSFQECWLSTKGAFGRMVAVIDSTQHVASISFRPDVASARSFRGMGAGLLMETEGLRRRWGRIAAMHVDTSNPPTRIERWVTKDSRWSSRIMWAGSTYPSEISVADETTDRKYRDLMYIAQADSIARATRQDLAALTLGRRVYADLQLVAKELERLLGAQDLFYARARTYAPSLANLHFTPKVNVDVVIRSAGKSGWWAIGKHELVTSEQCVIWVGASPQPPHPSVLRLGGEPRVPECGAATQ